MNKKKCFLFRFSGLFEKIKTQIYFILLYVVNLVHSFSPYFFAKYIYNMCGYKINNKAVICRGVRFFHLGRLTIGKNSIINNSVYLDNRCGISIGENVNIAHNVKIYTLGHDPHSPLFAIKGGPVLIDDYAVIFSNAMIMPNIKIGRGAVVMAGSVVIKDVMPFSMVGGNPAVEIGHRKCKPIYNLDYQYWKSH